MARVLAIIQLCFAFSLLIWVLFKPYMGDYFTIRSDLLLVQTATGMGNTLIPEDKLARHAARFARLKPAQQARLMEGYRRLEQKAQKPFLTKGKEALVGLVTLPLFMQAWMWLAIIVSVLVLKRADGIAASVWLLPLLALCYAVANLQQPIAPSRDLALPTEEALLQQYGEQDGLVGAWQRYLVIDWAKETPSGDPLVFQQQVESGEHALTVARAEKHLATRPSDNETRKSPYLLAAYVLWNLVFAWGIGRKTEGGIRD